MPEIEGEYQMTSINALISPGAAHLFTDGGLYDATGELVAFGSKIQLFPHLNAAVAANGLGYMTHVVWDAIGCQGYKTFDEMAGGFGQAVKDYIAREHWVQQHAFEAVLIGWSERSDEPQAWVMESSKANVPAFVPRRVSKSLTPYLPSFSTIDTHDPVQFALSAMEKQREHRWDTTTGGKSIKAVGGFVQQTTVTQDGISVKVIKRWADVIGQTI